MQCCGSARISIRFPRIRIQGFDDQEWKKFTAEVKKYIDQKLQFTYSQAFVKNVKTTGEVFIPQKRKHPAL